MRRDSRSFRRSRRSSAIRCRRNDLPVSQGDRRRRGPPVDRVPVPKSFGPDFPPETLSRLCSIPEVVGLKEASFDTTKTIETIDAAKTLPRKLGILTGSDTFIWEAMVMGCDGALIGFAGTATAELIDMQRSRFRAITSVARPSGLGSVRWHATAGARRSAITAADEGSAEAEAVPARHRAAATTSDR